MNQTKSIYSFKRNWDDDMYGVSEGAVNRKIINILERGMTDE